MNLFWIYVATEFEASHQLAFADGTRESLHSHPWRVTAGVYAERLNPDGLVMDFHILECIINAAVEPYRGKQLEKTLFFFGRNASAENLAKCLFDAIAPRIAPVARLGFVEITEAAGCRARYQPGV